ncbi:MAG: hypothetical protein LBV67_06880 [Streptococcaceae bacterium]|jgi:hypothetical protein|nr:hypothetical protein [Streptococcaceae bacterium]
MKNMDYLVLQKLFELKKRDQFMGDKVKTLTGLIVSPDALSQLESFNVFNWDEIRQNDISASEYVHQ